MLGREYRMPLNILYCSNEVAKTLSFLEYEKNFQKVYAAAKDNMDGRQRQAAAYYDKKVKDNVLPLG